MKFIHMFSFVHVNELCIHVTLQEAHLMTKLNFKKVWFVTNTKVNALLVYASSLDLHHIRKSPFAKTTKKVEENL